MINNSAFWGRKLDGRVERKLLQQWVARETFLEVKSSKVLRFAWTKLCFLNGVHQVNFEFSLNRF